MRDTEASSPWKKSITRTQIAMTGGIHLPGSCQFPGDPGFHMFAQHGECYPHLWEAGEFGLLHHFYGLIADRERDIQGGIQGDEYIVSLAHTVYKQLDRHIASVDTATVAF